MTDANTIYELITKDMYVNDYGEWVLPKDKDISDIAEEIAALQSKAGDMVMVPRVTLDKAIQSLTFADTDLGTLNVPADNSARGHLRAMASALSELAASQKEDGDVR